MKRVAEAMTKAGRGLSYSDADIIRAALVRARALFRAPVDTTSGFVLLTSHYVVAAGGQRFLFASPLKDQAPRP